MKAFIGRFIKLFIVSIIIVFLFGALILESFWGMIITIVLFLTILITAFSHQEARIHELESKIEDLIDKQ